ncbi:hypothetical protein ACFX13_008435 [Malus domestica]
MEGESYNVVPCSSVTIDSILHIKTAGAIWGLCAGPHDARKQGEGKKRLGEPEVASGELSLAPDSQPVASSSAIFLCNLTDSNSARLGFSFLFSGIEDRDENSSRIAVFAIPLISNTMPGDNTVKRWADDGDDDDWVCVQTLGEANNGHSSTVRALSFNASRDKMVTCNDDLTLRIWRLLKIAPKGLHQTGMGNMDGQRMSGENKKAEAWLLIEAYLCN